MVLHAVALGLALSGLAGDEVKSTEWMAEGLCTRMDPEVWYPSKVGAAQRSEAQIAQRICADCPVRDICKEYGRTASKGFGIWGGRLYTGFVDDPESGINHGTSGGYRMHTRRKVPVCEPCLVANRVADRGWRQRRRA